MTGMIALLLAKTLGTKAAFPITTPNSTPQQLTIKKLCYLARCSLERPNQWSKILPILTKSSLSSMVVLTVMLTKLQAVEQSLPETAKIATNDKWNHMI